jgi:virulence factor Mce-like protein
VGASPAGPRTARAGALHRLWRNPWLVIAGAGAVALALWVHSTRTSDHHLKVAFESATLISPGLDVRLDGVDVGKVSDVAYEDGEAIVTLGIDDGAAWPLRQGTRAAIRFGSTIGSGTRRIDLLPGPASAPPIGDGGVIGREDSITPVEFDQLLDTFKRETRKSARGLAGRGARALAGRGPRLGRGLHEGAGALDQLDRTLGDLAEERDSLRLLTPASARVVDTLALRSDRVRAVVLTGSETMRVFARRSRDVSSALDRLPSGLAEAQTTLRRLDRSAAPLRRLLTGLRPGARRLASIAPALRDALVELRATVPVAQRTVDSALSAAPPVRGLLGAATPFLAGDLDPTLQRATPMLECLTPYTPEFAGWFSTWAGFTKNYDAQGHYGRFHILEGPASITGQQGVTPAQVVSGDPRIVYARERPPGFSAGAPRFIPQCGYTRALLDPTADPELGP